MIKLINFFFMFCALSFLFASQTVAQVTATPHSVSSLLADGFQIVSGALGPQRARDVRTGNISSQSGTRLFSGQLVLAKGKDAYLCVYEVVTDTIAGSDDKSLSVCRQVR